MNIIINKESNIGIQEAHKKYSRSLESQILLYESDCGCNGQKKYYKLRNILAYNPLNPIEDTPWYGLIIEKVNQEGKAIKCCGSSILESELYKSNGKLVKAIEEAILCKNGNNYII